ncbi:MAG TPA: nucleotidyltransferase family protein [Anaeromyxobacteraceae bacterium]|nr:nucleotidyltransferase family protein [Anaeromyxobacteraceae bacterium]
MNPTGGTHLASGRRPPYNRRVTRDQVLRRLAETRAELAGLGVRSLDLFGSVVRGDADPDSDVDLLVEFEPGSRTTLLDMAQIEIELSQLLGGRKVDLRTAEDLSRYFRDEVARTAEPQYVAG